MIFSNLIFIEMFDIDSIMSFFKEYKTVLIVLCGAIITVIGALLDNSDKIKEKDRSLEVERKRNLQEIEKNSQYVNIINRSDKMLNSQKSVIDSNSKIIELQNDLSKANQKISELQNTTINQIIGGKPYIQIVVAPLTDTKGQVIFSFKNQGKFTIHSVSFEMIDTYSNVQRVISQEDNDKSRRVSFETKSGYWENMNKVINYGEIPPRTPDFNNKFFEGTFPSDILYLSYIFKVRWLNGFYTGIFNLKKENNTYKILHIDAWSYPGQKIVPDEYFKIYCENFKQM